MSQIILCCSNLIEYLAEAQRKMNTELEVIELDRHLHVEPSKMKELISSTISNLPEEYDTVLLAMGFCGGAINELSFERRVVVARVDDCVSLMLHLDDEYHPNLKENFHLYVMEKDPNDFDMEKVLTVDENSVNEYEGLSKDFIFHMFFDNYHNIDIVDTGMNDCYSEEYVMKVQETADALNASLNYVEGSNIILEKLVTGRWDKQFLIIEPGTKVKHGMFFE